MRFGFAEDEMNKLDAIHAYERGDFSANSEHPMVMKGVLRHCLSVLGRKDLNSQAISSKAFDVTTAPGPVYVIVQRGRTYFENRDELEGVRAKFRLVSTVTIEGATAAEVFVNQ